MLCTPTYSNMLGTVSFTGACSLCSTVREISQPSNYTVGLPPTVPKGMFPELQN